jgi:uncharacterized protein
MKRFSLLLLSLLLLCSAVSAEASLPRFFDETALLSETEGNRLEGLLREVSTATQTDVLICVYENRSVYAADSYFDTNGYGQGADRNGVLLFLSMEDRDWRILTNGDAYFAFNDDALDQMEDEVIALLSEDDYYGAFCRYAELSREVLDAYAAGEEYKAPFSWPVALIISLVIGLIAGFITVSILKKPMNSVAMQCRATNYVSEPLTLTQERDRFLYRTVTKVPKPKPQSSSGSHSSGGGFRGGRSGKF